MNFLELAEKRYSVRDYADKNVEEEKLSRSDFWCSKRKNILQNWKNLQISIMHHWQSLYVPTQKKHGRDHMMANRQQTLTPPL